MEKDYSNLHRGLVLKYFWQVIKHFKVSFFAVIILTIITSALDVFIPLQYLKLWNVLSINNFTVIEVAKSIIIFILLLNFLRWVLRRISGFSLSYFEARTMAGLREQAFDYLIGHSHSFFANNFSGSLTQRINKYARAFERITDRIMTDGLPLFVRSLGTVIAIYSLFPKYSYILGIFCIVFLFNCKGSRLADNQLYCPANSISKAKRWLLFVPCSVKDVITDKICAVCYIIQNIFCI